MGAVEHSVSTVSEKQGFAGTMENVFGDDAALVLGTIGALMGTLAAVGVVLNNNNINSLSSDQDALCVASKAAGNTNVAAMTLTTAGATLNDLNTLRTAINAIPIPT